jgi:hypothetical protein
MKHLLLGIAGVLFVALGVLFAVTGSGDDRALGLVGFVPFGVGGVLVVLMEMRSGERAGGVRRDEITVSGKRQAATIVEVDSVRHALMISGVLSMAVGCIGTALFAGRGGVFRVLLLGGGVAGIAAGLFILVTRARHRLVLTAETVTYSSGLRSWDVAWRAVESVAPTWLPGGTYIVLDARGADHFIPVDHFAIDAAGLLALMEHMYAHPDDRRQLADPGGRAVLDRYAAGGGSGGEGNSGST